MKLGSIVRNLLVKLYYYDILLLVTLRGLILNHFNSHALIKTNFYYPIICIYYTRKWTYVLFIWDFIEILKE